MSLLSPEALTRDGPTRGGVRRGVLFLLTSPPTPPTGPATVRSQFADLDFQGGDLLALSLGSDPPLLATPGQVGKAVLLVAFDGWP